MRFQQRHRFYCEVDMHARTMDLAAEPTTNSDRSHERDPAVLTGRRGGTDE